MAGAQRDLVLDAEPRAPGPGMITAREAFDQLIRDEGLDQDGGPLRITSVELGTAQYMTDRGLVPLPAWLFHVESGLATIAWPADRPERFWRLGEVRKADMTAKATGTRLGTARTPRICGS